MSNFAPDAQSFHIILIADLISMLYHVRAQLPRYDSVTEIWLSERQAADDDMIAFITRRLSGDNGSRKPLWVFADTEEYPDLCRRIAGEGRKYNVFLVGFALSRHQLPPVIARNANVLMAANSIAI